MAAFGSVKDKLSYRIFVGRQDMPEEISYNEQLDIIFVISTGDIAYKEWKDSISNF